MLVAVDGIGRLADQAKVKFWAQAWKAAHRLQCKEAVPHGLPIFPRLL
jgi:hypothetical protein